MICSKFGFICMFLHTCISHVLAQCTLQHFYSYPFGVLNYVYFNRNNTHFFLGGGVKSKHETVQTVPISNNGFSQKLLLTKLGFALNTKIRPRTIYFVALKVKKIGLYTFCVVGRNYSHLASWRIVR